MVVPNTAMKTDIRPKCRLDRAGIDTGEAPRRPGVPRSPPGLRHLAGRRAPGGVARAVVELAPTEQALDLLPALGFQAVPPKCDDVVFSAEHLARVKEMAR
jgi:hypothetical protein